MLEKREFFVFNTIRVNQASMLLIYRVQSFEKKEFLRENSVDKVVILRLGLASMKSAAG